MSNSEPPNPSLDDTEKDVIAWYKRYAQAWYAGNPNAEESVQYYAFPNYLCLPDGVVQFPDANAHASFFTGFIAELRSNNWARTTLLKIDVKMINPLTAFIETEVANETADGNPIEHYGAAAYSYLAGNTSEGWKFLSGHSS